MDIIKRCLLNSGRRVCNYRIAQIASIICAAFTIGYFVGNTAPAVDIKLRLFVKGAAVSSNVTNSLRNPDRNIIDDVWFKSLPPCARKPANFNEKRGTKAVYKRIEYPNVVRQLVEGKSLHDIRARDSMADLPYPDQYDERIKVVLDTHDRCHNASNYDAVMIVHTSPGNYKRRQALRWLYSNFTVTRPYRLKVVFFIGLLNEIAVGDADKFIYAESILYGDIVQGNFIDSYYNLTYKAILAYDWVDRNCEGLHGLIKMDDDVFINLPRMFLTWGAKRHEFSHKPVIMCQVEASAPVPNCGKWGVPKGVISSRHYRFSYCEGYFVFVTPSLVHEMSKLSKRMPYFFIDDVYMYGFVVNSIGGVALSGNEWGQKILTDSTDVMSHCLNKLGSRCEYFAAPQRGMTLELAQKLHQRFHASSAALKVGVLEEEMRLGP